MPPEPHTLRDLHIQSIRGAWEHGDLPPLPGRPAKPAKRRSYGTGSLTRRGDPPRWFGSWYTPDGRRVGRSLGLVRERGSRVGRSQREAEAELRRLIGASMPSRAPAERLTLSVAADRHIAQLRARGRKPSTLSDVAAHLRHAIAYFGDVDVTRIDDRDVEGWRDALLADGRAAQTVRNHLSSLSGTFARLLRASAVATNPVSRVELPSAADGAHSRLRHLEPEAVEAVIRALDRRVEQVAIRMLAHAGLRLGEATALQWGDVDFHARQLRVRRSLVRGIEGTPKSGHGRAVPLGPDLARDLATWSQESAFTADGDHVLTDPATGDPLGRDLLRGDFKRALTAAELPAARLHDLRHSFGVAMARAGAPLRLLQSWMGHSSITTTERYLSYSPDPHEGAAWVGRAFPASGATNGDTNLSEPQRI